MSIELSAAQNSEAWFCCILQLIREAVAPLNLTWLTINGSPGGSDLADQPSPLQWAHSWLKGNTHQVLMGPADLNGFTVN